MDHFEINLEEKKKVKEKIKISAAKNFVPKFFFPPYKVMEYGTAPNKYYLFQRSENIITTSDFFFFRIYYLGVKIFYLSKKMSFHMFKYVYDGRYGIKGLLAKDDYYRDYTCIYKTGEVKKNLDKVIPMRKNFKNILEGIKKSRENFENTPDNGLFGKNIGRIFNKIECYLFRFFIVGLIIVLGLGNLWSIFMIFLCTFMGLTSIFWVLAASVLNTLWRYIFYDYEVVQYGYRYNKKNTIDLVYSRYDLLKNPSTFFPLFTNIFKLCIYGFGQILHCFFLTVFYPFLALVISLFAFIRFGIRYVYDKASFKFIIKPLAYVPTRNTNVAWKIAGPGISKNLFFSLKFEDCIQLIIAQLEKEKISHFKKILDNIFDQDYNNLLKKNNRMLSKLLNFPNLIGLQKILQNKNIYKSILNQQVNERISKLNFIKKNINYIKIKFSEEELHRIKKATQEILKNNLKEYYISTYIWNQYKVKEGHFIRLSSLILKKAFGNYSGFFESIESVEERITLRRSKKNKRDVFKINKKREMISHAIKGDLHLNDYQPVYKQKEKEDFKIISAINLQKIQNTFVNHQKDHFFDLTLDIRHTYLPNILK